jgi:hypothetical protein
MARKNFSPRLNKTDSLLYRDTLSLSRHSRLGLASGCYASALPYFSSCFLPALRLVVGSSCDRFALGLLSMLLGVGLALGSWIGCAMLCVFALECGLSFPLLWFRLVLEADCQPQPLVVRT